MGLSAGPFFHCRKESSISTMPSSEPSQLIELAPSPAQRLCSACRKIFSGTSPRATSDVGASQICFYHHSSAGTLELTAKGQCPICTTLWSSFSNDEQSRFRNHSLSWGRGIVAQAKQKHWTLIPTGQKSDYYTWTIVSGDILHLRFAFLSENSGGQDSVWRSVRFDIYCASSRQFQQSLFKSWTQGVQDLEYLLDENKYKACVEDLLAGNGNSSNLDIKGTFDLIYTWYKFSTRYRKSDGKWQESDSVPRRLISIGNEKKAPYKSTVHRGRKICNIPL